MCDCLSSNFPFFAKNGKFDDRGKIEKYDFHHNDFFKNHFYSKFNADSKSKNRF